MLSQTRTGLQKPVANMHLSLCRSNTSFMVNKRTRQPLHQQQQEEEEIYSVYAASKGP